MSENSLTLIVPLYYAIPRTIWLLAMGFTEVIE
jgi:hypothetical protein